MHRMLSSRKNIRPRCQKLGMSLILVPVRNTHEFDPAFAAMLREHADALLMTNDPFHQRHIQKILAFLA